MWRNFLKEFRMGYFFLTLFLEWLLAFIVPLFFFFCGGAYMPFYISIPVLLVLGFFAMWGYEYLITKHGRPRKPLSKMGVYVPLVLPAAWYVLNTAIWNVIGDTHSLATVFLGIWTGHIFGAIAAEDIHIFGLDEWHSVLVLNLIYDAALISGFAVGEHVSAKKKNVEWKLTARYQKAITAVLVIALAAVYIKSEFSLFRERENIVESADPYPAYDFYYAGGYSSIDLDPYAVENEKNILVKLGEPSTFILTDPQEMPILDGAEAAFPVYSAFANACYENIAKIQKKAMKKESSIMPIQFTNTIYAYEKLLSGEIDIFFGAKPSKAQLKKAEEAGVELKLTPIGQEAFVFFVNEKNPVDGLSSEQLRSIYSGQTVNWRDVGGENKKILAFQRPENSGSQTMMEYFMGDVSLKKPLEAESVGGMGDVVKDVAIYNNSVSALGYSFRYYTTIMMEDLDEDAGDFKLLSVDGVYPDTETIRSGEYPYITQLYAITAANRTDAKSAIEPFLEWMTGPQGQQIVSDTGYVAVN